MSPHRTALALATALLLAISACSSSSDDEATATTAADAASTAASADASSSGDEGSTITEGSDATSDAADGLVVVDCDVTAALFVTGESVNPDLDEPEVAATCEDEVITVVSNGVPDFTYIGTSPGVPDGREFIFTIPGVATMADTVTDVPYIGPIGVTLTGIPIYGPTEGTGGDVDSLPGIISACGSHNGPGGFHTHKILASTETDCWFSPEEVAAAPQLVGYAFDGIPIYTGIDQYTSSWQLTDETLFASDTWAAHTYIEGSGDLDQCNGLRDDEGNYAYYTTAEFPYVLGCFAGEVEIESAGANDERPERPEGDDGERPERPEGDDGERPERPVEGGDA